MGSPLDPQDARASETAERVLLEGLARDERLDVEALCRAHPALAGELRELGACWELANRQRASALLQEPLPPPASLSGWRGGSSEPGSPGAGGREPRVAQLADVIAKLADAAGPAHRYVDGGEIARGAQGVVRRAFDATLQRHVAMKVLRDGAAAAGPGRPAPGSTRRLGRFVEEAQVTAQLDHPAIVPVHDLGLDAQGAVYFTMKLVKGRSLHEVLEARAASAGAAPSPWNTTRLVGSLVRVAEAMSFAHDRGVVHRDLKPANIMLGEYGEVYVMDWGLARVLAAAEHEPAESGLRSERRDAAPGSSLLTLEGDVVGTPSYMAPEQASGQVALLGPAADVYALGAILYHVLAGRAPFTDAGRSSPLDVLALVRRGPPVPLQRLVPAVPPELAAICEKAMAREAPARYASMAELAEDLRAFLESRVVRAYETGAWAEARKWVRRNRLLAGAAAAVLAAVYGGLLYSSHVEARGRAIAQAAQGEADRNLADVLRLSDVQRLEQLQREEALLWPADPEHVPALAAWLDAARALLGRNDAHRATLAALAARAEPGGDPASPRFASQEDSWWHATLSALIDGLDRFSAQTVPGVERRLARARDLQRVSLIEPAALWEQAIASIADPDACPAYGGLRIVPQLGLVPLGRNAATGLWEFWDVQLGERPVATADGRYAMSEASGPLFVLLPGGTFLFGGQGSDPEAPNYDPSATPDTWRVQSVRLDPFFIAAYEVTQAQWERGMGSNPSAYASSEAEARQATERYGPDHPVESVTWGEARELAARFGHVLPTQAQWEYAARAGSTQAWWTGGDVGSLQGAGNVSDASLARQADIAWPHEALLDDGFASHAPVGSFRPNAFGLYDTIGNVAEWTRDPHADAPRDADPGDGGQPGGSGPFYTSVGGAWSTVPAQCSSAFRIRTHGEQRVGQLGLRLARRLALPTD